MSVTRVNDAWKAGLGDWFRQTFDGFGRALSDCPDSLWEESLWHSTKPWPAGASLGAERPELERPQLFSAFWFVAWHAIDVTHYDLEGQAKPAWAPPQPFSVAGDGSAIERHYYLPLRVITRSELQDYVADTRRKAEATIASLTDEDVGRSVPVGHRYAGIPYASLLLMCLTHSRDHLAQLEMFLGQRGIGRA